MAVPRETLLMIRAWDPDSWEHRPTPADYWRFKSRVIRDCGHAAWVAYRGAWDEPAGY